MIFDGLVTVYSTCRRCNQLMQVIDADEYTHPTCEPKPTKIESLATGWLSTVLADDIEAERYTAQDLREAQRKPPELHRAATYYAKWGWPVFPLRPVGTKCTGGDKCKPLCQCPKAPATLNGFKDATTDLAMIDKWWFQPRNIGLATGHLFDAIDIDPRHGGVQSFLKLLQDKRFPDIHGIAVTASGGMHLYIKPTGKGNSAGWMPGVDHRGKGGYVVAPPSTLGPRGRSWSWMTVPSPMIKGHNE
jgi:hypothetical protein